MQTLDIKILDNHNMEKCLGDIDDFVFEGQRLCLAPGYRYKKNEDGSVKDGSIEILEFSLYKRDSKTGEIIY